MTKKKILKIIAILLLVLIVFGSIQVFAVGDPFDDPEKWKPSISNEQKLLEKASMVLNIINVVGLIIAVIVLAILGIKYLVGSLEERATYKKSFGPYLLGMFLLAAAVSIPNIIYSIINYLII